MRRSHFFFASLSISLFFNAGGSCITAVTFDLSTTASHAPSLSLRHLL